MENKHFTNYKYLKSQFAFKYKGFEIDRILAISIWYWSNSSSFFLCQLPFFFKKVDYGFLEAIESDYVLYSDEPRKDHNSTFNQIANKVKGKYVIINKSTGLKYLYLLSIRNIIKSFILVFSHIKKLNLGQKICVAGYLCMYINTIDELLRLKIKVPKKLVLFSAVHEKQNLLSQFYKMKGTQIIGLTHGTQFIYKNNIPIDCINYENLDVECLVWSQMTKDEYIKYGIDKEKVFVAGYPKNYQLKPLSINRLKKCLVLLCRKAFDDSNMRLLNLLSSYVGQYDFFLKLHPSCEYTKYKKISEQVGFEMIPHEVLLSECMDNEKYDFAIAVNTTSYYEILIAGIPCLRFEDGDVYDLMPGHPNDCISTKKDFEESLAWLNNNEDYEQIRDGLLHYNLGLGIDCYYKLLNT